MPVKMRKLKNGRYRVTDAGKTTAKSTTKEKARKQSRLLRAISHGWRPSR